MNLSKSDRTPWVMATVFAIILYAINHNFMLPITDPDTLIVTSEMISEGSMARRVQFIGLAVIGVLLIVTYRYGFRAQNFLAVTLLGYLAWCAASIAWSGDAYTTLRRIGTAGCLSVAAIGVARHYSGPALAKLTLVASAQLIATGLFAALFWGTFQPWEAGYRLIGTLHPNATGLLISLFSIAALTLTLYEPQAKKRYWSLFVVSLGLVVVTGSRSALASLLVSLFVFALLSWSRERKAFVMLFGACASCALLFAYGDLVVDTLWDGLLLGRGDTAITFTGRLPLWQQLASFATENLWCGVGYYSFWTTDTLDAVSRTQDWQIESAHSAYMEVLLDLGLVGLTLYLVTLFGAAILALKRFVTRKDPLDLFWGMLMRIVILGGFLESIVPGYPGYLIQFISFVGLWRLAFVDDRKITIAARRVRSGFSRRAVSWKTTDRPDPLLPVKRE